MSKPSRRDALAAIAGAVVGSQAAPTPIYARPPADVEWMPAYDPAVNPTRERALLALQDAVREMEAFMDSYPEMPEHGREISEHEKELRVKAGLPAEHPYCGANCPACLHADFEGMLFTLETYVSLLDSYMVSAPGGELERRMYATVRRKLREGGHEQ